MIRRAPLIGVTAFGYLLALAVPASAGGAWVLWEESHDLQTFQRTPSPHPKSSYASLEDLTRNEDTNITYVITYTCLPDSVRPPEPKGK